MRFQEGNSVEVLRKEKDPCGYWLPGIVISVHENTYIVRYERLVNQKGEPAIESVNEKHVRPQPPQKKREIWMAGDIGEVFDVQCWRVAEIVQATKNVHFIVRLIGSSHLREFHKSGLRIRQVWHNDGWSVVGKFQGNKQTFPTLTQDYLGQQWRSCAVRNLCLFPPVDDVPCPTKNKDGDESIASYSLKEHADGPNVNKGDYVDRSSDSYYPDLSSSFAFSRIRLPPPSSKQKLKVDVHKLELQAYKSTMKALYASGPLSWEQESFLTDLRRCLHISNNEHLLQLRHILSSQAP